MPVPTFTEAGDLPQGVHHALLREVLGQFAQSTPQRKIVGMRLARVYELAAAIGHMKRFIVFGSFVTAKLDPNDVDVFLIMHDTFDLTQVTGRHGSSLTMLLHRRTLERVSFGCANSPPSPTRRTQF